MTERSALIVGASRGLGFGLARELLTRGWRVIGTGRRADAAQKLKAALGSLGPLQTEMVDILEPAQVESLAQRRSGESLDLVVLNAGVAGRRDQSVQTATSDEVAHIMMTNAIAPVRAANSLLPLVKRGGTVAFMSSLMGSVAENHAGGMDLYRASKAALNSMTRGFVAEAASQKGVHVLSLHPGWVRTDMGGEAAPLSVEESTRGLADVLERGGNAGHRFVDYSGKELPW